MKKIILVFIIILSLFSVFCRQKAFCVSNGIEAMSNEYCIKGDKILDYYERLENKTNGDRYLNAAKYFYYQASRVDLSNPNALIGRARVAVYQNRIRDAKNDLMVALNFNEVNPRVSYYLGEVFFIEGNYTEAIDYYNWAYSHGYRYDYKTNLKLGVCYEKLNDVKMAKKHYTNAINIMPASVEAKARLHGLDAINTNYGKVN